MKCINISFVFIVLTFAIASGFNIRPSIPRISKSYKSIKGPLFMGENTEIVPLEKQNIENAAAVTGGILGLVLVGPIGALVLAAITNYVVKKENDSGEALRGLGKTVIESYNFLNKLNSKYNLTGKTAETLSKSLSSVETDSETLDTVKKTVTTTVTKIDELNKEYDFVTKGKQVASAAAVLSDTAIEKLEELNAKVFFY